MLLWIPAFAGMPEKNAAMTLSKGGNHIKGLTLILPPQFLEDLLAKLVFLYFVRRRLGEHIDKPDVLRPHEFRHLGLEPFPQFVFRQIRLGSHNIENDETFLSHQLHFDKRHLVIPWIFEMPICGSRKTPVKGCFYKDLASYYEELGDMMKGSALNDFILPNKLVGIVGLLALLTVLLI